MKSFVTGGAGFIGSHLVEALVRIGHCVHVIDNLNSGKKEHIHKSAIFHNIDVRSVEAKNLVISEKPDYLFHLAAQADVSKSTNFPCEDLDINVNGTINLLEACKISPVKNFIFSSTSAVYGNTEEAIISENHSTKPISFYGLSKLTAESYITLYHKFFNIPYTILRYGNVYGPRQNAKGEGGVIPSFLKCLKEGSELNIYGDGLQTRDYIHVRDIVESNICAATKEITTTLQISTGKSTSLLELIKILELIHSKNVPVRFVLERPGDIKHSCLANNKAKNLLNWSPTISLGKGIEDTYSFVMKENIQ
ncbi:NAD-dependent epimerase/dehydratase family protein [Rossellomorea sp. KS-H15a]|uniref:NAD-dependent epimerase/dehydratase family protein n=1 Tax=Rossellomorea sp. KS-H15a TaxID=2963940 RepID=UPI0020C6CCF7|nr:NAD-dependent epimerase/dehydratase family protein [Rossellomorea sp. KS-H15a]UTE75468.1 GDP-mannose 4,6-dehydratase [Rossellomorea sp. KS-H15a]